MAGDGGRRNRPQLVRLTTLHLGWWAAGETGVEDTNEVGVPDAAHQSITKISKTGCMLAARFR